MTAYLTTDEFGPDHPVRRYSEIARVDLVSRGCDGKLTASRFNSSFELFDRLEYLGRRGEPIVYFSQGGKSLARRSVGALNAFLGVGRGLRYWRRMSGEKHRWAWSNFVAYLGLKFNE